jgi:hypothetical protein
MLVLALLVGGLVIMNRNQTAFGNDAAKEEQPARMMATGGPHYTVLETEGTNLVVTDNAKNTLYFYTVDKGKAPGSELKLRATVDLNQVGKETIKPVDVNIQK